jgi:hypothetical protein
MMDLLLGWDYSNEKAAVGSDFVLQVPLFILITRLLTVLLQLIINEKYFIFRDKTALVQKVKDDAAKIQVRNSSWQYKYRNRTKNID